MRCKMERDFQGLPAFACTGLTDLNRTKAKLVIMTLLCLSSCRCSFFFLMGARVAYAVNALPSLTKISHEHVPKSHVIKHVITRVHM